MTSHAASGSRMSRIFSPTSFGNRIAVCLPLTSMLMKIGAALPGIRSASSQYRWQSLPLSSVPSQIVLFVRPSVWPLVDSASSHP